MKKIISISKIRSTEINGNYAKDVKLHIIVVANVKRNHGNKDIKYNVKNYRN